MHQKYNVNQEAYHDLIGATKTANLIKSHYHRSLAFTEIAKVASQKGVAR